MLCKSEKIKLDYPNKITDANLWQQENFKYGKYGNMSIEIEDLIEEKKEENYNKNIKKCDISYACIYPNKSGSFGRPGKKNGAVPIFQISRKVSLKK